MDMALGSMMERISGAIERRRASSKKRISRAMVKKFLNARWHRTSISLEDQFRDALKEIAKHRKMTVSELVSGIDNDREFANLSSVIRLFVGLLSRSASGSPTWIANGCLGASRHSIRRLGLVLVVRCVVLDELHGSRWLNGLLKPRRKVAGVFTQPRLDSTALPTGCQAANVGCSADSGGGTVGGRDVQRCPGGHLQMANASNSTMPSPTISTASDT
jgi:predicted DNA-binding ribbon-helix-helix protein